MKHPCNIDLSHYLFEGVWWIIWNDSGTEGPCSACMSAELEKYFVDKFGKKE